MQTVEQVGVTAKDLRHMLHDALEELGKPELFWKIKHGVTFNNRLKTAGARVGMSRDRKTIYFVEVNPALKMSELEDCIRHEALHIVSGLRDGDPRFERMAHDHDIPLHVQHGLATAEKFKYRIMCADCGEVTGKYKRRGKYIKMIENGTDRLHCGHCSSSNLYVEEV